MAPNKAEEFHILGSRQVKVLSRLRELHGDMTLLQAMMFFRIASDPGITQRALWGEFDVWDSVASRAISVLSHAGVRVKDPKTGEVARETKALNLIEVRENPLDRREKQLHLTSKGRTLMQDIERDLGLETGRAQAAKSSPKKKKGVAYLDHNGEVVIGE